jgi:hypothetical protein
VKGFRYPGSASVHPPAHALAPSRRRKKSTDARDRLEQIAVSCQDQIDAIGIGQKSSYVVWTGNAAASHPLIDDHTI